MCGGAGIAFVLKTALKNRIRYPLNDSLKTMLKCTVKPGFKFDIC
ncbi:hypothetical protein [Mycobacteroides abscessus]|nr:hypothetical protein [Mycobacteroides abscessus]MDB2305451.1 hypothetical protein [Mycobacteroides abscessus subsp. massiliense]MDM2400955.1 hypothetical protein [Mycobacteroides abscessus]MDM2409936.1 hypothetical protein [Mycobacteroides abscessus]MDO2973821.1 hypothetical protein [Mycobacteroides abscessus subsp. massiliense]MDO3164999.1 hypothetical protein [Mycobacteroides abscessus subsp. massiliense]